MPYRTEYWQSSCLFFNSLYIVTNVVHREVMPDREGADTSSPYTASLPPD